LPCEKMKIAGKGSGRRVYEMGSKGVVGIAYD
jgi:hypothetical protein